MIASYLQSPLNSSLASNVTFILVGLTAVTCPTYTCPDACSKGPLREMYTSSPTLYQTRQNRFYIQSLKVLHLKRCLGSSSPMPKKNDATGFPRTVASCQNVLRLRIQYPSSSRRSTGQV